MSVTDMDPISGAPIPLGTPFEEFGLSVKPTDTVQMTITQRNDVTVDGKQWRATGGSYINVFSTGDAKGAVIADTNFSPASSGERQEPPIVGADIVPLKQWSDIVFLQWQVTIVRTPVERSYV